MFNILTLNKISPRGLSKFSSGKYTYGDALDRPDAVMVRSASMIDMDIPASVLAIARAGAGVNNIPVDACTEKGIVVFNTPGANANAVKELVLCALLISSRKVPEALAWCQTLKGEGERVGKLVEKGKSAFTGQEVMGKTLGVIGLGAIGILVANTALALGMNVVGYDLALSVHNALSIDPRVTVVGTVDEVIAVSDYISLHTPLNDSTRDLVNAQSIAQMKDGVRILNFARGELVNSADIIEALASEKVAAYATDFPTDEQICSRGVIAIPHLGASTPESEDNCAVMGANQLVAYLERGEIVNSVNLPYMQLPMTFETRVCVIHKDMEGIQASITAALAGCTINSLTGATRNGWAYTVADINGAANKENKENKEKLEKINGVVKVRVL
ncbi:MAG TPA: 3-phosphoglycerate dehydrogenase family protein [Clostridia bacterium]|nr:3-phosphoglycerate dehydrogenase family protein [Clostridia bacterium]